MRRIIKAAAGVAAGLLMAGSITVLSTPGTAEAAAPCGVDLGRYGGLSYESRGTGARALECALKQNGYSKWVYMNQYINKAELGYVNDFQRKKKLKVGGLNKQTWTAMLSTGKQTYVKWGSRSEDVKRLQRSITAAGRYVPPTGYFGPDTESAVKAYQRSMGLKITGTGNEQVWGALQKGRALSWNETRITGAGRAEKAVTFAYAQIGDMYGYGATGPNRWDCSGLTQGAWKSAGVSLPRTTTAQYDAKKKVSRSSLRPGDIVFYYSGRSHSGIYVGGGQIIHSSRAGEPVAKVSLGMMPYNGAVRPA